MLKSPLDLVWIFAIFGLVIVTIGFGVSDVVNEFSLTEDQSYFTSIEAQLNSSEGLQGTASRAGDTIGGEGEDRDENDVDIITGGYNTMKGLGKVFSLSKNAMTDTSVKLGIPAIYWQIISAALLISFFVVLYTWIRGKA